MSTRKIREALEWMDGQAVANPSMSPMVRAALAEVEAIQMAAKALQFGPPGVINDRAIDAWLDMGEAIAKESK